MLTLVSEIVGFAFDFANDVVSVIVMHNTKTVKIVIIRLKLVPVFIIILLFLSSFWCSVHQIGLFF